MLWHIAGFTLSTDGSVWQAHTQGSQLIFGKDQDELVWSGWPKKWLIYHIFCTKHFLLGKTLDLHLLFHYKWRLEEFVSPRIHIGLRLLLRICLQQHKHGHLPYVPAEIFITDACGFHLSDDFITFQRLLPTKDINSVQKCAVFL